MVSSNFLTGDFPDSPDPSRVVSDKGQTAYLHPGFSPDFLFQLARLHVGERPALWLASPFRDDRRFHPPQLVGRGAPHRGQLDRVATGIDAHVLEAPQVLLQPAAKVV